jgi:DNA (cytosine-5)-methyltransferase 1
MKYGSVCSGIEAATHAWHPLGWEASFFSEIEKFPRQVLAHHYPDTPLHGDFTTIQKGDYDPIKLLVGGTPCQSFSVAGLRAGLNDPRGNLMLEFGALAKRLQPKWLVWENVPGVLSSNSGRDFGSFLAMLGELGYGFAYRVLDAQHFGVPQRRRRVFVIGCLGDFGSAAAVLFEQHSLQGHTAESKGKRQEIASTPTRGFGDCGPDLNQIDSGACDFKEVAGTLTRRTGISRNNHEECVAVQTIGALDTECGFQKASHQSINAGHILPIAYREADLANYKPDAASGTLKKSGGCMGGGSESLITYAHAFKVRGGCEGGGKGYLGSDETAFTISTSQDQQIAVACDTYNGTIQGDVTATMTAGMSGATSSGPKVITSMQVRRLMPIECERLQGFRDDFTNIPGASDSTRYKALGNSMAVPVMAWIGKRIDMIEKMQKELK